MTLKYSIELTQARINSCLNNTKDLAHALKFHLSHICDVDSFARKRLTMIMAYEMSHFASYAYYNIKCMKSKVTAWINYVRLNETIFKLDITAQTYASALVSVVCCISVSQIFMRCNKPYYCETNENTKTKYFKE